MIKNFWYVSRIVLFTILLSGCNLFADRNQDPFYEDSGDLDYARFPLIKPYDAVISNDKYGWQIMLRASPPPKDIYYYYTVHDVGEIAVEGDIIMIYTPFTEQVDESVGHKVLHYFFIVPNKNLETGFVSETDFLNYIQTYGIEQPNWLEPDEVYKQFENTGC
jgi:hypothetical protein